MEQNKQLPEEVMQKIKRAVYAIETALDESLLTTKIRKSMVEASKELHHLLWEQQGIGITAGAESKPTDSNNFTDKLYEGLSKAIRDIQEHVRAGKHFHAVNTNASFLPGALTEKGILESEDLVDELRDLIKEYLLSKEAKPTAAINPILFEGVAVDVEQPSKSDWYDVVIPDTRILQNLYWDGNLWTEHDSMSRAAEFQPTHWLRPYQSAQTHCAASLKAKDDRIEELEKELEKLKQEEAPTKEFKVKRLRNGRGHSHLVVITDEAIADVHIGSLIIIPYAEGFKEPLAVLLQVNANGMPKRANDKFGIVSQYIFD